MPTAVGLPPNATAGSGTGAGNGNGTFDSSKVQMSDKDIQLELDRIFQTLQVLKEKGSAANGGGGGGSDNNAGMALKIAAIQEALKTVSAAGSVVPGPTATTSTPPSQAKPSAATSELHQPQLPQPYKKDQVQILNGQVVNCQSAPLLPVNNQSPPKVKNKVKAK